ncbi:MAG TPA: molybdopterin molybdotransferase MoeA [Bacilli bacterium]
MFATGSELLPVGHPLETGKIRNSNGYMIAAQVKAAGGIPLLMETVSDDADQARKVILQTFSSVDLVITTGGVSVGDYDIMVDIFAQWEGQLLFNKIALRPGSPTTAGVWQDKFLIALSGNPGACFVGFELFAGPALRGFQGMQQMFPTEYEAFLGVDYPKGNAYPRYIRGRSYVNQGKIYVIPSGPDKSSIMTSIKDSDCLIIIPPGGKGLQEGQLVTAMRLNGT